MNDRVHEKLLAQVMRLEGGWLGIERLRARLRFISAVQFRNWEAAGEEMMISDWAKQEPRRASVLAEMMRTGRDDLEV